MAINGDHLVLSKTLRATPREVFSKVTLPSAVPVIFAGFRLGLIFSLLGVVGAELLAAEHGLGQTLAYLQSSLRRETASWACSSCSPCSASASRC